MHMSVLPTYVYMCAMCMPDAHRDQKRASDALKLELGVVVCHYVGRKIQTWVLYQNNLSSPID